MIIMAVDFFMMAKISKEGKCHICVSQYFNICEDNSKSQAASELCKLLGCLWVQMLEQFQCKNLLMLPTIY